MTTSTRTRTMDEQTTAMLHKKVSGRGCRGHVHTPLVAIASCARARTHVRTQHCHTPTQVLEFWPQRQHRLRALIDALPGVMRDIEELLGGATGR